VRLFALVAFALVIGGSPAFAQEHAPAAAATQAHAAGGEEHHEGPLQTVARLLNFGILVGVLGYFLRTPIATYLASRSTQIRQDLVTAAEMKKTATAQLEEIARKLAALPAELEALRTRGAEDVKLEKERIAAEAAAERQRLIEQTRREIAARLQIARRELKQYAAELAVQVAEQRIKRNITVDDQIRMVDRYSTQLREAR
jgi:F-type H+-transporting ATPase subunit b